MKVACVIVTRGDRPAELARAVASAAAQDAPVDILVVGNGAAVDVQAPARAIHLPQNVGPPGARNAGIDAVDADVVFFLDDDAAFADPAVVGEALRRFVADERLGIISFRIVDPEGGPPQRRHVPRLRAGDPGRSSDVTTFLEGACAIRRAVFERAGVYPPEFYFDHEGSDLAWRALDAGFRIRYAGDLAVNHPAFPATRHAGRDRLSARNRVFLARRRLPWALALLYCLTWLVLGLARASSARDYLRGFIEGMRASCGERAPIRWRTVWRMTTLGRPPVV